MNRSVRTYKARIRRALPLRLRKAKSAEFDASLAPFLEDVPDPSYDDLVQAFGSPEDMADTLLGDFSPRSRKPALLIACFLVLACGIGWLVLCNQPENALLCSDSIPYSPYINQDHYFAVDDPFTHKNSEWTLAPGVHSYLVEAHNTGKVPTQVTVYYAPFRSSHHFQVLPGQTETLLVNHPSIGKHSVAVTTPDGSVSGTVRVRVSSDTLSPA